MVALALEMASVMTQLVNVSAVTITVDKSVNVSLPLELGPKCP